MQSKTSLWLCRVAAYLGLCLAVSLYSQANDVLHPPSSFPAILILLPGAIFFGAIPVAILERLAGARAALAASFVLVAAAGWYLLAAGPTPHNGTAVRSHLKNLGTALEMYATDNHSQYPSHLLLLAPFYLKTLPDLPNQPGAGRLYERSQDAEDYTLMCSGRLADRQGDGPYRVADKVLYYTSRHGLQDR